MIYFHHDFVFMSKIHFKQNISITIASNMNVHLLIFKGTEGNDFENGESSS